MLMQGHQFPAYYPFTKAAGSFLSLISGIPGGLFDPSLSVGAGLGQLAAPLFPGIEPNCILLMCMVAYFGGVVQSPLTAIVIILEMTTARNMILPLFLTGLLAYESSHLVCRYAIYEALSEIFLESLEPERPEVKKRS